MPVPEEEQQRYPWRFATPEPMPSERQTTLLVNDQELLTVQTTPVFLEDWAAGFLYTEGFIDRLSDLGPIRVETVPARVEVALDPDRLSGLDLAGKRYLTSGCGKGVTFSSIKDAMTLQPVDHALSVTPDQIARWLIRMQKQMPFYIESGGMHAAAVVRITDEEMLVREDIGRHNAVDKAIGAALKAGWQPGELVLCTTGRISYEMCAKVGRCGLALCASLTAATDQAVRLANRLGVDLIGYARSARKYLLYTEGRHLARGEG